MRCPAPLPSLSSPLALSRLFSQHRDSHSSALSAPTHGAAPHAPHAPRAHTLSPPSPVAQAPGSGAAAGARIKSPGALGQVDSAMFIAFTCKVCDHRNRKSFSRQTYEKGVVLIRCGGCENLHLIADNLGWFDGARNVEEELARRGESVARNASVLEFHDVPLPRSLRRDTAATDAATAEPSAPSSAPR